MIILGALLGLSAGSHFVVRFFAGLRHSGAVLGVINSEPCILCAELCDVMEGRRLSRLRSEGLHTTEGQVISSRSSCDPDACFFGCASAISQVRKEAPVTRILFSFSSRPFDLAAFSAGAAAF